MEALEVLADFNKRLLQNIPILVKELSGKRVEDTDKFQKTIIDAINWEVQVMNGTMDLLNEGKQRIDKEAFNEKLLVLGKAIESGEDENLAAALESLQPQFEILGAAAEETLK
jgi:hypothetical protein